uniref:adenine phosphoribosyltransferase-like isoform X1 n=1 Tax=Myxine glutinosa TaxID=7769 RepID=UPI00359018F6
MAMSSGMVDRDSKLGLISRRIRDFPDFPKPGIVYKDICPLLADPVAFCTVIDLFAEHVKTLGSVDLVMGLEARGFLFGPSLAQRLSVGFVPVRKKGKLPGATVLANYSLEYGKDEMEIQADAIQPGQRVIIVDDVIATGGTLEAACKLVKQMQGEVVQCLVVMLLPGLQTCQIDKVFHLL